MTTFFEMMLSAFNEGAGVAEYDGMPSEIHAVVSRGIDQFPRSSFAKMGRHFLDGKMVHYRTVTDAADRLLTEGDSWDGERDEWSAARDYVQRLENLRAAMIALQEAAAAFDEQADALNIKAMDRNALFSVAITKK